MYQLIFLLAWRYIRGSQRKKIMSSVMYVVFLSILIGAMALTLTIAIMKGFEKATYARLQSIHPQIMIRGNGQPLDYQKINTVMAHEFPDILHTTPEAVHQVILQDPTTDEITTIITLKGIEAATAPLVYAVQDKLINSHSATETLPYLLQKNNIIIGKKLAISLGLAIGDTVRLLYTPHLLSKESSARKRTKIAHQTATISGFFSTGIEEFDMGLALTSLDFFAHLFPTVGITGINIKLNHAANETQIIHALRCRLELDVFSWKDLYLPLVSALKLEKYAMGLVLTLIMIIACMNIISLLLILITQKRSDIALLQTIGMRIYDIQKLFMLVGLIITGSASLIGICLAGIIAWFIQQYPCISLPDVYFVSHVPVDFSFNTALTIFILIMTISFITVIIPIRRLQEQDIADLLRFTA